MKTQSKTLALSAVLATTLGLASVSTFADTVETATTPVENQHAYQFQGDTNPNAQAQNQLQSQQKIQNRINEQQAVQMRVQAQQMQNNAMQIRNQAMQMRNAQTNMQTQQKMQSQFRNTH